MSVKLNTIPSYFCPATTEQTMFVILSLMLANYVENVTKGLPPKSGDYSLSFLRKRLPIHAHNVFEAMEQLRALGLVTKVRASAWSLVTENAEKANEYIRQRSLPVQPPRFVPGMDFQNHMSATDFGNPEPQHNRPTFWNGGVEYKGHWPDTREAAMKKNKIAW